VKMGFARLQKCVKRKSFARKLLGKCQTYILPFAGVASIVLQLALGMRFAL